MTKKVNNKLKLEKLTIAKLANPVAIKAGSKVIVQNYTIKPSQLSVCICDLLASPAQAIHQDPQENLIP